MPVRRRPVLCAALVAAAALGALGTACSSTARTLHATGAVTVRWAAGQAEAANGTPPSYTAVGVCGSNTETYLAELVHVAPTQVKVLHEWGDIVAGGKQILASGTVAYTHLGPTDLPTSHPYGDDLSMDVVLDPAFLPFTRALGPPAEPPGQMHVEISAGMIPHQLRPSEAALSQTWRQLSDFNLTGFQPGFDKPNLGDRVLVMGRWIIDCGHPDYNTELHPMAFLAWAQRQGNTTVARTYFNPYHDTEIYSPDPAVLGQVDNTSRLSQPGVKPFPPYLIDEVVRVATGQTDHLHSLELIDATHTSPARWQVCAPAGTAGHHLQVHYDLVTRPGVTVSVVPDEATGCATVQTLLSQNYRPAAAVVRQCALPWSYLDRLAKDALGSNVDVKGLIDKNVPAAVRPLVDRDPVTACADALAGPTVDPAPTATRIRVDDTQPIPFYGVVTVGLA